MEEYIKKMATQYEAGKLTYNRGGAEKTDKDYLDRFRHYYGMYAHGDAVVGANGITGPGRINFKEIRDYAAGLLPIEKFRDIIDPITQGRKTKRRFRKVNISWRPSPTLPKHVDRLKTRYKDVSIIPVVTATDEASAQAKEFIVSKMKLAADPRMKQFSQAIGVPIPDAGAVGNMTQDDIMAYHEMGGIALPPEIAMKDALDDMFEASGWDVQSYMVIDDGIKLGAQAVHVYEQGRKLMVEYIDPARYFRRRSEYPDGRDTDFKAFIKTRKIHEVRRFINDERTIQKLIAQCERARYGDRLFTDGRRKSYDRSGSGMMNVNDDTSFDEMTLYFVDTQVKHYMSSTANDGSSVFKPVSPDAKMRPGREMVEVKELKLFKGKWAVGTDIVYDCGIANNIAYGDDQYPIFPIADHISQEPSLMERCIGHEEDKHIALYKLRQVVAKIPPGPRMFIDKAGLKASVNMGDEEFSFLDMLRDYPTTGILVGESEGAYDLPGVEGSGARREFIKFLESGVVEDINILRAEIAAAEESIRQVTGSNPLEDGIGQPDMLKHTAESMTGGMNSAVAPHIENYVSVYRQICNIACQKWMLMVLAGDITVGNEKKTTLTKELFERKWNVKVKLESSKMKEMLLQDLISNKMAVPEEAYYEIYNAIMQGDLRKAQIMLTKAVGRSKEMEHQRMIEVQKAQAEGNMQAGIATEQERAKTEVAKMNAEKELEAFKADLAEKKAKEDHKRAKEMAELNAKLNFSKDVTIASIQAPVRQGV